MGSESGSIRGVLSISCCRVVSLPLSSFCAFPAFSHSSPSWQCFCNPQSVLGALELHLLKCWCSCLEHSARPCAQEGDVGAEQQDYSSWSLSCSPKGLLSHAPVPIYQPIQPPWPVLGATCHYFVKQTGHLGREAAAVLLPGVSGICSLHTHTDTHRHTQAAFT